VARVERTAKPDGSFYARIFTTVNAGCNGKFNRNTVGRWGRQDLVILWIRLVVAKVNE
jgi:hypothetical protein